MPSPIPKPAAARARTNKAAGARTLTVVPAGRRRRAPRLPEDRGWHDLTRAWWKDVWASPMAPEYDPSDLHGLYALAALVDDFWTCDDARLRSALAAEIRLQRQCFGLTPIDRRRLQWEISRGDEAERKTRARKAGDRPAPLPGDPRAALLG
jgi:hypothetical protein